MNDHKPAYKAYLLRLWEEDDHENGDDKMSAPVWRASMEDASTHERHGFEGLEALFEFLENQVVSASQASDVDRELSTPDNPNILHGGTP